MAAAPPAAGATPGTPHTTTTTATMAAHSITTYAEHYAALPDDLQGRYDRLLAPYDPASSRSHQQLLHRLLSMSDTSPKAFVGLVEHSGSYCTVLVHRITLFKSHPVDVSDWDGKALGFGGDVMPGNHIELMEVPEDAFAVAPEHVVPTRENVTHLLSGNPTVEVLGPFTAGDPDTEPLKCRKMVPVPAAYLHLLLDRTLTPRQLWEQVGGAIIADAKEVECGVLLNWIRAALTARSSTATPPPPPPATLASPILLGRLSEVFPPIRVEPVLQAHRWEVLRTDLPALDPSRLAPTDQMASLVDVLRLENAAARQDQVEARARAAAPKTPTSAFPQFATIWRRNLGVADDGGLPHIYHLWANSTKAERRVALQTAFNERVESGLSASRTTPLATKELYEMVVQGQLASHLFEGEDLSKGLSPFTCGFQVGERDTAISARALRFDQMQLGHTAPTLAEQDTLRTKEVPVPQSIYELGTQLACTSMVLDVVLGDTAPLATTLHNFCIAEWPLMEASLHAMGEDPTPILPSMLRWVQLQMASYFRGISTRRHLPLPTFEYLHDVVQQRTFHLLPPMPSRYITTTTPAAAPRSPGNPPTNPSSSTPSTSGGAADVGPSNRDPGQRVANPNPIEQFTRAYTAAGRSLSSIRGNAPSTTDRSTNTPVDLCLSYHLRGGCYSNCQRSSTHRPLTAPERRLMTTFVAQYLPPAPNTPTTSSISTTNASPSGAAPTPAVVPAAGSSNRV